MNIKLNRSRTYIVPLLNSYIPINKGLLLNSYLYDINNPDYNADNFDGIFLLFKWSPNILHKKYEEELLNNKYVKLHYDHDEHHFVIYCEFPDEVIEDCLNIIEGKFSRIKDINKHTILKFWEASKDSKLYCILYKIDAYRKSLEDEYNVKISSNSELGSIFNISEEIFNFNKKTIGTIN